MVWQVDWLSIDHTAECEFNVRKAKNMLSLMGYMLVDHFVDEGRLEMGRVVVKL